MLYANFLSMHDFSTGSSPSQDEKPGKKILDLGYVSANCSFVNVTKYTV